MIEQLWLELEAEGGCIWRYRLARKDGVNPLVIALEPRYESRTLLISVPGVDLPARREWPECRGLEWLTVNLEGKPYWGVRLRDKSCSEVFTALAGDLDRRLAVTDGSGAAELFGRLKLWKQFLKSWQEEMGSEARRGIWGELYFLNTHLLPALGANVAVESWKAGRAAHQDFQFPHAAVEVKTTAAKQPQNVRITSERQLDDTGAGTLYLHVVVVDEREVLMSGETTGLSLPALVQAVRDSLSSEMSALALFNDLLLERGWIDELSTRYERHRFTVRKEASFQINPGFPRIVESDLLQGVGDVNYALSLPACEPFLTDISEMLAILKGNES